MAKPRLIILIRHAQSEGNSEFPSIHIAQDTSIGR